MTTSIEQDASAVGGESSLRIILFWSALILFILGGIASGAFGMFRFSNLSRAILAVAMDPPSILSPFPKPKSDDVPDWQNKGRVTILVMGVDRRPDEGQDEAFRTDTMMLVTIDPANRTAGMLSIPRDLLVPIPMASKDCFYLPYGNPYGQERINAAYVFGQLCKYPGGGAALAKDTVQYNFGVKVHYYVMVDFQVFQDLVDAIGGVDVDVAERLIDYNYPTMDYGTMKIDIAAGHQHFDGEHALWYARSRHSDSDFGRMKRQQQLVLAMRDKALQLGMLTKLPQLALQLNDAVRTDLSTLEEASLVLLAKDIDSGSIVHRTLEFPYVTSITGQDGASYQVPMRDRIREVIADVFGDPRLSQENAKVEVLNGANISGLAGRIAQVLKDKGVLNVVTGNVPDGQPRRQTEIITYTAKETTANRIAEALGVPVKRTVAASDSPQSPDIRVILGQDLQDH